MRFTLPWIPAAKKNDVDVVPIRKGGKTFWKPVPSARVKRHQHAIGVLFSATFAWFQGWISEGSLKRTRTICRQRSSGKQGVGHKSLDTWDTKPALPMIDAGNDVALYITVEIGEKETQDRCVVGVRDLGPRPDRKRKGRGDLINVPAIIADALNERAFADDKAVVELHARIVFLTD